MPLTSLNMEDCSQLTDDDMSHLQGIPLARLCLRGIYDLTDVTLEHLRKLPLTEFVTGGTCTMTLDGMIAFWLDKGINFFVDKVCNAAFLTPTTKRDYLQCLYCEGRKLVFYCKR